MSGKRRKSPAKRQGTQHQIPIGRRARPSSRRAPVEKPGPRSSAARPRGCPFGDVSPARLGEWIEDYLAELAATEHRPRTLKNYRHALLRLRPELRAAVDAAGFLRALARLAPATRAFYLAAARGFDAWCVESGRTRARALGGRARVKLDKPAPKPFESAELRQLGAAAADPWRGQRRYAALRGRVRLLVVLLQETGLRIEDVLALHWRDVVLAPGREGLHVRAPKGRAAFFVPLLPGPLVVALKRTARAVEADAGDVAGDVERWGHRYVLAVDAHGAQPWSYRAALAAFQRLAAVAGVERATPHRMRHSRATQLVEDGISIQGLQHAMAWAKVDTAARYVRYTAAHLRRELERLSSR